MHITENYHRNSFFSSKYKEKPEANHKATTTPPKVTITVCNVETSVAAE